MFFKFGNFELDCGKSNGVGKKFKHVLRPNFSFFNPTWFFMMNFIQDNYFFCSIVIWFHRYYFLLLTKRLKKELWALTSSAIHWPKFSLGSKMKLHLFVNFPNLREKIFNLANLIRSSCRVLISSWWITSIQFSCSRVWNPVILPNV